MLARGPNSVELSTFVGTPLILSEHYHEREALFPFVWIWKLRLTGVVGLE